jgi:hypothetical protein
VAFLELATECSLIDFHLFAANRAQRFCGVATWQRFSDEGVAVNAARRRLLGRRTCILILKLIQSTSLRLWLERLNTLLLPSRRPPAG